MPRYLYPFMLCLTVFLLASCSNEEEVSAEPGIRGITLSSKLSKGESMQIDVLIEKPTPCHSVEAVNITTSGTTYYYDIMLISEGDICAQVIEEERLQVVFDAQEAGEYTLNFLINGKQQQSRKVQVSN